MRISKFATEDIKTSWLLNIPKQQGKTFDFAVHHLCQKHFEDKFILKTNTVTMGSQVIAQTPRIRWKLTDDAVPTIFSNTKVPKYYDRKISERKPPKIRCDTPMNKIKFQKLENNHDINQVAQQIHGVLPTDFETLPLPPLWTFTKNKDSIRIFKLVEDEREAMKTFHSERCITVSMISFHYF